MKNLKGKTVRIISDNENYSDYLDIDLVITYCNNDINGMAYDSSMYPEMLCDLETLDGEEVPFSLYECEFEII